MADTYGLLECTQQALSEQCSFDEEVRESKPAPTCALTILVPAYNEAASIADTVHSLLGQTLRAERVIVIDDGSSDGTAQIARQAGAEVMNPGRNTGSKAGAQNFALQYVDTKYVMAIDADTILAPNAVEMIMKAMDDDDVAAACGFVLPRFVRTIWERGRYVEYLFAFSFFKTIQDYYGKPLISSGCFSVYQTCLLKQQHGWSTRTMAEDMDLTWSFYQAGYKVRFIPEAVSYPIEPHNYHFMGKQLKRWSHGFIQNVRLHWKDVIELPVLRNMVAVAMFDATIASIAYLFVLPVLAVLVSPWFILAYLMDMPAVAVPVLYMAYKRGEVCKALASLPSFLVLRFVNGYHMIKALWLELVMHKPLLVYEKGH